MSIPNIVLKIKALILDDRVFVGLLVVLTGVMGFGLGRLSVTVEPQVRSIQKVNAATSSLVAAPAGVLAPPVGTTTSSIKKTGTYVGSKKGNKYHLPWCSGAKRITELNQVWFSTKEEAAASGYTPAANCPGI